MLNRIQNKLRLIIRRLPIWYYQIWLALTLKHRPRFKSYHQTILGYRIKLIDPKAFFHEFQFIFLDDIYGFKSTRPDPTIIDGGGYIGLATLYFKYHYPQAHITVFEPDTEIYAILQHNLKTNRLSHVASHNVGLYRESKEITFNPNHTDGGKIDHSGTSAITVKRLSDYIDREIDFLKLNIEGAELAVLEDLDASQKIQSVKEMCIEWHSFANQDQNLDELLAILKRNNFRYYIGNFRRAPRGNFKVDRHKPFYLLIYAKNLNL